MKYRRIFALGDIHGRFDRLSSVFNKIAFDPEQDFLVLLIAAMKICTACSGR